MLEATMEERLRRRELKTRRDLLFSKYQKNPMDTQMALEIKAIDDQLANDSNPIPVKTRNGSRNHKK